MARRSVKKQAITPQSNKPVDSSSQQESPLIVAQATRISSGPIPHPDILRGYEEILPGSADRILSMAEGETKHRHEMEEEIIHTEGRDSLLGIVVAGVLALCALIAGVIVVLVSNTPYTSVIGAIFGLSGIGSIIVTMINSTRRKTKPPEK